MAIPSHLRAVGDIATPEAHIAVTEARLTGVTSNITKGRNTGSRKKSRIDSLRPPLRIHRSSFLDGTVIASGNLRNCI
jgi:hypothetical protein